MTDIFIDKFRGIREQNPVCEVVSSGQMSAVLSQNVELEFSQNGDHVGIRTVKGDTLAFSLPDVMIYGFFESVQEGASYYFVYGARQKENGEAEGVLWSVDLMKGEAEELKSGLQAKENCNGITIAQGFDDWFVFTNGADDYVACRMKDKTVQNLNAKDAEGRDIRGLCLESYDGRLVTNSQNRVHWSKVQDIFEWSEQTTGVLTNPAYQEFDRDITALTEYMKDKLMEWLEFLQMVCVPAFVWLVYKVGELRKELNDFKVQVAREYATQVHITRLELKIDELRQLIWEIHNESKTTKRD